MKENNLRDLIAQNISKLKPGLTLLKKEQYIPNKHGTKSFIDLYAKDEKDRHILIELKRSNAAARQAIHEVNKYIESVKYYFGVKDSEIHVIIASTEWAELLLPFSRFYADAGFSIEGIKINVDNDKMDFEVESVTPLTITQGRFIAPWHNVYWYADKDALQQGISEIEKSYREKGIEDYIIVKIYIPNRLTEEERSSALRAQLAQNLNVPESELSTALFSSIPVHEYIAYTALQILSKDTCIQIISGDTDTLNEVQEILPDMNEEEALCYLHECVEAISPRPKCDHYEIGYPAKFSYFSREENGCLCGIVRHGIFKRNPLLNDDMLYAELKGEDGSTGQKFKQIVDVKDLANIKKLKENIANTLEYNPVWRSHILRIIEDIKSEFPDSKMEISVFNPGTGVLTFYYAMVKEYGFLYIPNYYILVKNPNDIRMYFGTLEATGSAIPFSEVLKKYYHGNVLELLLSMTWGGNDIRDSDIIEDLGAQYRSYRVDISNDQPNSFFTLRDEKWRECEKTSPTELFDRYLQNNEHLMKQILLKIQPYDEGVFFDYNNSDKLLEEYVDMQTAQEKQIYYSDAPDICDICECSLTDEKFMIDGAIRENGVWANMCGECFLTYGNKIGWGYGQLYLNDAKGGWLLVGGFCPDSDLEPV